MEKTPHSDPETSVKGVSQQLSFDFHELPVDMSEKPKDDVSPPLPFAIDMCFHNEDMKVLKQKYKVMSSSSSVSNNDHLKNLGFHGGCQTRIHYRNKRVHNTRNSPNVVGRFWLKEFTKKDEGFDSMVSRPKFLCSSKVGDKDKKKRKKDILDRLVAKVLLKDFLLQAKARASAIKKKGKKKKKVRFAWGPGDGIVKKRRSFQSNVILRIKKEDDA